MTPDEAQVRPWEGHDGFEVLLGGVLVARVHADRTVDLRGTTGPAPGGSPFAIVGSGGWVRTEPDPLAPDPARQSAWPPKGFWLYRVTGRGRAQYQSGPM